MKFYSLYCKFISRREIKKELLMSDTLNLIIFYLKSFISIKYIKISSFGMAWSNISYKKSIIYYSIEFQLNLRKDHSTFDSIIIRIEVTLSATEKSEVDSHIMSFSQ